MLRNCLKIGPWKNPNKPAAKNWVIQISRKPVKSTSSNWVPLGYMFDEEV
jgi:hypothetical protein